MKTNSLLKALIKNEQLKLPIEGIGEEPVKKPKVKKPVLVDRKLKDINYLTQLETYLTERGKKLNEHELLAAMIGGNSKNWNNGEIRIMVQESIGSDEPNVFVSNETINKVLAHLVSRPEIHERTRYILGGAKISDENLQKILDKSKDSTILNSLNFNPHLTDRQYIKTIEKHPDMASGFLETPRAQNPKLLNYVIENTDSARHWPAHRLQNIINHYQDDQSRMLSPSNAQKLIRQSGDRLSNSEHFDYVASLVPETERNKLFKELLGIEGGHNHDEEAASSPENNWDNWIPGDKYQKEVAKHIAKSKHLTDDMAEHIKRHGNFEEKYAMYHDNPHIDPRHGAEMYKKWADDEDFHGYSSDELVDANREKFNDKYSHEDLSSEEIEEIEEQARDSGEVGNDVYNQYSSYDYYASLDEDDVVEKMKNKNYEDNLLDQIYDHLHENHEWTGENPNSKQNIGNDVFDKLDSLAEKYGRDDTIDIDDFKEETGLDHPSQLGLKYDEKRGYVDGDDLHDEINKWGGPSQIDFANHDNLNIDDHPEFEERYSKSAKQVLLNHWNENMWDVAHHLDLYDDYYESEEYNRLYSEALKEYVKEKSKEKVAALYDDSHIHPDFVPEHVIPHVESLKNHKDLLKKKKADGPNAKFLDSQIKNRLYDHEYSDNLHHLEMAKDYADAKGGSIDIGTLHKLHPNQKEIWKNLFGSKGKLSSEEIQQKIAEKPKTKYDVSYGKWDSHKIQNTNGQDEVVIRLDHSEDSLNAIKQNPDVYETFKKVQELSKRSGHPTNINTIGWARVDFTDPKKPFISELQSDYGKTVREYLKKNNLAHKAEHIKEIEKHHANWRENLLNLVLKTAKANGAEKVYTHSPESKAKHTEAGTVHSVYHDSYGKVPRNMGFKPVHYSEMPLTESGRGHFKVAQTYISDREADHTAGAQHHLIYHNTFTKKFNDTQNPNFKKLADGHKELAQKHLDEWKAITNDAAVDLRLDSPDKVKKISDIFNVGDTTLDSEWAENAQEVKPHKSDSLIGTPPEPEKSHQGHVFDLQPQIMKKNIDLAITLIKAEALLVKKHLKNQDITQDVVNIEMIRKMLGHSNLY